MPMRVECKHYESRTYASGETVRMCRLDLAPEAPWRCPENCQSFTLRRTDIAAVRGSLTGEPTPEEPPRLDDAAIALLDEAEDIINAAGPAALAEVRDHRERQRGDGVRTGVAGWWQRLRRRGR